MGSRGYGEAVGRTGGFTGAVRGGIDTYLRTKQAFKPEDPLDRQIKQERYDKMVLDREEAEKESKWKDALRDPYHSENWDSFSRSQQEFMKKKIDPHLNPQGLISNRDLVRINDNIAKTGKASFEALRIKDSKRDLQDAKDTKSSLVEKLRKKGSNPVKIREMIDEQDAIIQEHTNTIQSSGKKVEYMTKSEELFNGLSKDFQQFITREVPLAKYGLTTENIKPIKKAFDAEQKLEETPKEKKYGQLFVKTDTITKKKKYKHFGKDEVVTNEWEPWVKETAKEDDTIPLKDQSTQIGKELSAIYKRNNIGKIDIMAFAAMDASVQMKYLEDQAKPLLKKLEGKDKARAMLLYKKLEKITNNMIGEKLLPINKEMVQMYFDKAGGNKEKARILAEKDGYKL